MDGGLGGDPKFGCSVGEGPSTHCAEADGWLCQKTCCGMPQGARWSVSVYEVSEINRGDIISLCF